MTPREYVLTFVGAFLGGAGFAFGVSLWIRPALVCLVAQAVVFAVANGWLARLWRRVAVGRYPVYTGRAVLTRTPFGFEARAPSHIGIPPGYAMTWRAVEVDGQPAVHYEVRPARGFGARWRRLRYPHPIDRRGKA